MRYIYFCIVLLILANTTQLNAQSQITVGSTTLDIDTVVTGLDVPWEVLYGPDGKLWVTERSGIISRIDITSGDKEVLLNLQNIVHASGEAGMLGMVLHPDFPTQPYLFVTYNFRIGSTMERTVRYTFDTDTLIAPVTYLDSLPGNSTHNGCRMVIGPDSKIYMTTGDVQNQPSAQDLNAITGKVLRLELDGSVPTDNPIAGSYIYSWGHRNAQGLTFGPTGILYSSEHGPTTNDELNIIEEARNYGWPSVVGYCNTTAEMSFCADSNVREPLLAWTPTIATSDLIYYDHPAIPEWQGSLLMTVLKNKQLKQLSLNAAGDTITNDVSYLSNQFGRLRDIAAGPDGTIYIATNGANWGNTDPGTHSIIRLKNNAYQSPLELSMQDTFRTCGSDNVTISANVTGGTAPYSYQWKHNSTILPTTTNTISIQTNASSSYTYYIEVTDASNNIISDSVTIIAGSETTEDLSSNTFFNVNLTDTSVNSDFTFIIYAIEPGFELIEVDWDPYYTGTESSLLYEGDSIIATSTFTNCTINPNSYCTSLFTICAIDLDNCRKVCSDSTFQFTVTTVAEIELLDHIQLYPNPAQNRLYVQNITEDIDLSIIDLHGRTLVHENLKAYADQTIDLSELASGMYLVKMVSGNGGRTTKLLVD